MATRPPIGAAIAALDGCRDPPAPGLAALRDAGLGQEDQPPFVNAAASVETTLPADELLQAMLALEQRFGRVRGAAVHWGRVRWTWTCCCGARCSIAGPGCHTLTCTRARAFVLVPLAEIAPDLAIPGHGRVRDAVMRVDACGIAPIG